MLTLPIDFSVILSNGHSVQLDANNRPELNYKGYVTRNLNGNWSVVCDDEIDFNARGAETAGQVCLLLGLKGYRFFNKTLLTHRHLETELKDLNLNKNIVRSPRQILKHVQDHYQFERLLLKQREVVTEKTNNLKTSESSKIEYEPIVASLQTECTALYVECVPHASSHHDEFLHPEDQAKLIDLRPLIFPDATHETHEIHKVRPLQDIIVRYPWLADIYINGEMKGMGILLDHYWVLTSVHCLRRFE